jgi:hypothetical protein
MAAKLTRLTHKIAIQLYLLAETWTVCSSHSRRPVRKFLDTPSYFRGARSAERSYERADPLLFFFNFTKSALPLCVSLSSVEVPICAVKFSFPPALSSVSLPPSLSLSFSSLFFYFIYFNISYCVLSLSSFLFSIFPHPPLPSSSVSWPQNCKLKDWKGYTLLTYSMVQDILWKADTRLACQTTARFLMESEGAPWSQKPATGPYPEPAEFSSSHRSLLPKAHLNVILPSTPRSCQRSLTFGPPNQNKKVISL